MSESLVDVTVPKYGVPFLGFRPSCFPPDFPVVVEDVVPGSWADRVGLVKGDELFAVNDQKIFEMKNRNEFFDLLKTRPLKLSFLVEDGKIFENGQISFRNETNEIFENLFKNGQNEKKTKLFDMREFLKKDKTERPEKTPVKRRTKISTEKILTHFEFFLKLKMTKNSRNFPTESFLVFFVVEHKKPEKSTEISKNVLKGSFLSYSEILKILLAKTPFFESEKIFNLEKENFQNFRFLIPKTAFENFDDLIFCVFNRKDEKISFTDFSFLAVPFKDLLKSPSVLFDEGGDFKSFGLCSIDDPRRVLQTGLLIGLKFEEIFKEIVEEKVEEDVEVVLEIEKNVQTTDFLKFEETVGEEIQKAKKKFIERENLLYENYLENLKDPSTDAWVRGLMKKREIEIGQGGEGDYEIKF